MSEQEVISIQPHEEVIWAKIMHAQMDEELTTKMQQQVNEAAEKSRKLPVALDLSEVEFFPSLSLGALVTIMSELKKHQQRLVLVGIQPPIRGALAVTRLDKLFEIYEDVDEAIADLDTSYLEGTADGAEAIFTIDETVPISGYEPMAVKTQLFTKLAEDSQPLSAQSVLVSGGTSYYGSVIPTNTQHYKLTDTLYLVDPYDSAAWTLAKIAALKLGVKCSAAL